MVNKCQPVQWLSVTELWNSAKRASLSKTIGDYVDRREVFAALDSAIPPAVGASTAGVAWIDYVADVGDGYQATRAVAICLNEDLDATVGDSTTTTERGSVLVFGGDQVYPTPSVNSYDRRFRAPYEGLLNRDKIYALPGNHDWYDGLTAFYKVFVAGSPLSLDCVTQERSYFSFQVDSHPWWVWGLDFGLSGALDVPQTKYFEGVRDALIGHQTHSSNGLVICTAEPFWEKGHAHMWDAIKDLIPSNSGAVLFLSGDKHYFASWAELDEHGVAQPPTGAPPQLAGMPIAFVTAGGGGAYLSLPEDLRERETVANTAIRRQYPEKGYRWSLLGRIFSPRDGIWPLTAVVYGLMITIVRLAADQPASFDMLRNADNPSAFPRPAGLNEVIGYLAADGNWWTTLKRTWTEAKGSTAWWVGVALIIVALLALARKGLPAEHKHTRKGSWITAIAGLAHSAAHVAGIALIGVASLHLAIQGDGRWTGSITLGALLLVVLLLFRPAVSLSLGLLVIYLLLAVIIFCDDLAGDTDRYGRGILYAFTILIGGGVIGHAILITYLWIASKARLNLNEASVALASEDYKNFVRLRVAGPELTIFGFGIDDTKQVVTRVDDDHDSLDQSDCKLVFYATLAVT